MEKKMKKFTFRGYLFSILALFSCMNVAHALVDQMHQCTVPGADGDITYVVKWMASSNGKVYSTFGVAKSHAEDSSGNLLSLSMQSNDYSNHWSISRNDGCCGKKTWNFQLTAGGVSKIEAKHVNCKPMLFDQELATKTERFYSTNSIDYSLKYMIEDNPIKLIDAS